MQGSPSATRPSNGIVGAWGTGDHEKKRPKALRGLVLQHRRAVQAPHLPYSGMHAVLAFSTLPLFLGAVLSDWAYARSYEVQWTNFASWLIAGGLVFAGFALLWAAVDVLRPRAARPRRGVAYVVLLLATFVLGFVNSLVHAKDAWAAMPGGLVLSVLVLLLAAAASVIGLATVRRRSA